ncbi:hypothetical protein BHE74_00056120, partial [Ensete ventricosum]
MGGVPPKSTINGRLREKSTVGSRLREKKKEEEEKKKEVPPFPHRPRPHAIAARGRFFSHVRRQNVSP